MRLYLVKSLTIILIISFGSSCNLKNKNTNVKEDSTLGDINIEISCSSEAGAVFQDGLLLLHSFQFKDAEEKFQKAQRIDSTCAMAYWGEAMSQNHPLWREQNKEKAISILEKIAPTNKDQRLAFKTPFEQDMFDAISILYGSGTKKENDIAYSAYMENLYKKYPDNHEVHAFYALSLLGAIEDDRKADLYSKGAKIAQSIINENPNHPGALHYLIHSYDDPLNAHKALQAADRYSKVAPDAAHALHMPSHIYVALGKWDKVISSNIAAVAASIERKERKALDIKAIDFHSLKWQMYGHLQKGEYDQARKLVEQMESFCEKEESPKAKSHTVMMKAAYLSETNQWNDPLLRDKIDYSDLPIQVFGTRSYMLGMEAFESSNVDSLKTIINHLSSAIAEAETKALIGSSSMCSGNYDRSRPTLNHVKRTKVMQLQLKAQLAMIHGDQEEVESLMQKAIEIEESTTYLYGPPEIVKPSHEMYAEWLHSNDRYKEAKDFYFKVLDRAPGRYIPTQAIKQLKQMG